ncbi:MAG: hypothetical protein AAF721_03630 [Myxococcota bacterium]
MSAWTARGWLVGVAITASAAHFGCGEDTGAADPDGSSGTGGDTTDGASPTSGSTAGAETSDGADSGDTSDGGTDDGTDGTDGGSNCDEPGLPFVPFAESDIADLDLPNIYVEPEVDTSDWTVYDVTCQEGADCTPADGSAAFPSAWGCDALVGDDATDNATALVCLWWGGQAQGSDASTLDETIFFIPDGTYNFGSALNGVDVFRPDILSDHRGLRGESRAGTILQTTNIADGSAPQVNFFETEFEADIPGDAGAPNYNYTMTDRVAWNAGAGAARGSTTIEVADTDGFVDGGWVELRADSTPEQTVSNQLFRVRIVPGSIVPDTSLEIDRPLPDDFTGGNATAIGWRPSEGLVFEHFTLRMKYPDHQQGNLNWLLNFNHTAESHVVDVDLHGYQVAVYITESARIRYAQNTLQLNFDKPFNTYGIALAASTHLTILDSYFFNTPEGIACGSAAQEIFLGFNHFAQPEENSDYDSDCNGGDGNDCVLYLDGHNEGPTAHGTTLGGGYLHCSNQENDVLGLQGSASCHGTRCQDTSGSFLLHNGSCSNTAIVRNVFESGVWVDWSDGPGRRNLFFGNVFREPQAPDYIARQRGGLGNGGDFSSKNDAGNAAFVRGYRFNPILVNNSINALGGGSNNAFDAGMQDATISHNVFRERCDYDGGSNPSPEIAADCGATVAADPDVPAVDDASISWSNNDVGVDDRTWTDLMPSAPGFDADPGLSCGSGPFPYIGADMGPNGGTDEFCLPAKYRHDGGC